MDSGCLDAKSGGVSDTDADIRRLKVRVLHVLEGV